jgi:hypothetical protein
MSEPLTIRPPGSLAAEIEAELERFAPPLDYPIDPGIRRAVLILRKEGIETFESCQGGAGHIGDLPWIRFHGSEWAGFRAFAAAMEWGLPVYRVMREWDVDNLQLVGPNWRIEFRPELRGRARA